MWIALILNPPILTHSPSAAWHFLWLSEHYWFGHEADDGFAAKWVFLKHPSGICFIILSKIWSEWHQSSKCWAWEHFLHILDYYSDPDLVVEGTLSEIDWLIAQTMFTAAIRVISHLSCVDQIVSKPGAFPPGSVCLGICEHSNHVGQNKQSEIAKKGRSRLASSQSLERFFVVWKQMNQPQDLMIADKWF